MYGLKPVPFKTWARTFKTGASRRVETDLGKNVV
jgi:hypothetical protein